MTLRSTLAALAAGALLTLGACDNYDEGDVYYETRASFVDFRLNTTVADDDYSDDGYVVSFDDRDAISPDDRDDLQDLLAEAGDGALVVAYIDSEVVLDIASTGQTYSAMPITRAYEGVPIRVDEDGDGTPEEIPYVDVVVTYEYSFDNAAFYFDVTSSAQLDFAEFLPNAVDFRVVVIPADRYNARAGARVDLRDYEAVKAAYGLPD